MSKEPSFEEMNTPIELSDLPHDVLVSIVNHTTEGRAKAFARDVEDSAYHMRGIADAVNALRKMVELSPFSGNPTLIEASSLMKKARDALATYAEDYGVLSTEVMPVRAQAKKP